MRIPENYHAREKAIESIGKRIAYYSEILDLKRDIVRPLDWARERVFRLELRRLNYLELNRDDKI